MATPVAERSMMDHKNEDSSAVAPKRTTIRVRKSISAILQVSSVFDRGTGRCFLELYRSDDKAIPVAVGKPVYTSHEEAESDAIDMIATLLDRLALS